MKKKIAIHQFSPSAVSGDGIGNGMFYLQKILREIGFESNIYAEDIESSLKKEVLSYKKIDKNDIDSILFIHYSIYYDFSKWIDRLKLRKIMIYHNITPYKFFKKDTLLYNLCKRGVEYLPELSSKVEGVIGDSKLNSKELKESGFKNIETIPFLIDKDRILESKWNYKKFNNLVDKFNIIFIGRIARNKAQKDLIEIANIYAKINNNFKLYIIGGVTDIDYKNELEELIDRYNLKNFITITGKVSNEELYAYYRASNIFLCMSEHEGFGIPLIEAMLFNVPVIAYNSSNIKDTMNGGGVLFNKKSFKDIAGVIELIRVNHAFKREIIKTQKEAIKIYEHQNILKKLISYLNSIGIEVQKNIEYNRKDRIEYQFEGPFDSSYSLAILNRYSALTFENIYPNRVSLFSTEGGGDYKPNREFLKENPKIDKMYRKSKKGLNGKVVLRNLYPPRVTGMRGDFNILNSYGWEESGFPREYVEQFNQNLDGITVMSEYVKSVLIANGVTIPIEVVGLGVNHILKSTPKPIELNTNKKFKFLHISSCFPRKGIDILLKAYIENFTNEDSVTLIIKTFPNPHNKIEDEVKKIKSDPNSPEIILINRDLDESNIAWLYQNSNALVAPSRGEGFGLPMAEAMLFNLPVITTNFGGQVDFCREDTSWLIDYSFSKAKTHLNLFNSYWVEPNLEHLKYLLKEITTLSKEEKELKTKKAYNLIYNRFKWEDYRYRTEEFIKQLDNQEIFLSKEVNLGWISSYNTKCGIATYSDFLLKEFSSRFNITIFANSSDEVIDKSKESRVIRCWKNRNDISNQKLIDNILEKDISAVVINFNFAFFSTQNLKKIVEELYQNSIKIIIIFHSIADITIKGLEASLKDIKDSLKLVNTLLVHTIDDMNFFKNMELTNMALLPHGIRNREKEIEIREIKTIATYGFLLPHKGILELIETFAILKESFKGLKLLLVNSLYPIEESREYYLLCKQKIEELGLNSSIEMHTDFLTDEESFRLLDSSDLLIMPYRKTQESASGAIRYAISTMRPIVCTPQPIFSDVEDIVHFTKGFTPKEMVDSIKYLIENQNILYSKIDRQREWIIEHDWSNISRKLQSFINS